LNGPEDNQFSFNNKEAIIADIRSRSVEWRERISVPVNLDLSERHVISKLVSGSWVYAESRFKEVGMGRPGVTVVTRDRVTNSEEELVASMERKRWVLTQ
jgi:hypothetical protein